MGFDGNFFHQITVGLQKISSSGLTFTSMIFNLVGFSWSHDQIRSTIQIAMEILLSNADCYHCLSGRPFVEILYREGPTTEEKLLFNWSGKNGTHTKPLNWVPFFKVSFRQIRTFFFFRLFSQPKFDAKYQHPHTYKIRQIGMMDQFWCNDDMLTSVRLCSNYFKAKYPQI